jgi:hypothetical protein
MKGILEKLKRTGNLYIIRTVFKMKHTLRSSLIRTRLERSPQQMAYCVYSIPCECVIRYIGETGKPLAERLRERRHHLTGLLKESKLAQHAYEDGHRVGWNEARGLETESNSMYRKYKEPAHMAHLTNPTRQSSPEISPTCIPRVSKEVSKSQGKASMM